MDLANLPLFERLAGKRHVLIAGAGGGFDVYCGLPLRAALRARGAEVSLANLTFTYLGGTDAPPVRPALYRVDATVTGEDAYFPERDLAAFLDETEPAGAPHVVHTFDKVGVAPLRAAYRHLVETLGIDAIVLIDGGTDILMHGDEAGLGTPTEDATSLAAVAAQAVDSFVVCLGFGVDTHHGVCHAHFLENVAGLQREGAFLGAFSLLPQMPEARPWLALVERLEAKNPGRASIVNGSIASAVEGHFGDHHRSERTRGSELFVSPLMSLYWAFELQAVAAKNQYLDELGLTRTVWDVQAAIEAHRHRVRPRPKKAIPH